MRDEHIVARIGNDELVRVGYGLFATYWDRHVEDRVSYQTSTVVSRRSPMGSFSSDEDAMREWRRRLEQKQGQRDQVRVGFGPLAAGQRIPGR